MLKRAFEAHEESSQRLHVQVNRDESSRIQSLHKDRYSWTYAVEDEVSELQSISLWSPSPPRKRRRINYRSPPPQITTNICSAPHATAVQNNSQSNIPLDAWDTKPLFGCPSELSSVKAAEERRSIVKFLDGYRAGKESGFSLECRLTDILETAEWWGLIGCNLCFASTGQLEPDHDMNSCTRESDREKATSVLRWLEDLAIPRSCSTGRGFCSLCAAFHPCSEVVLGDRAEMAHSPVARDYWIQQFESRPGPDGH